MVHGNETLISDVICNEHDMYVFKQDTAGSERYEAMSRIYYRGAKAAVLCYGKGLALVPCHL